MNEIFFRVDERLVHGQILFKWLEHASCSKLYIIDDQVATDPILQGVLTMTVPESVEVFFYSADEGARSCYDSGCKCTCTVKNIGYIVENI